MNKLYINLLIVSLAFVTNSGYSQAGDTVLKLELTNIYQTNFFQLSYEFNIDSGISHEISLGTGKKLDINYYSASYQFRHYIEDGFTRMGAPTGFHLGPRIKAIYISNTINSDKTFGGELDALFGYQAVIAHNLTLDPYTGVGLSILKNGTYVHVAWGLTVGYLFD